MSFFKELIFNGFVPLIPIMVWNIVLGNRLPDPLKPANFNKGVPLWVIRFENGTRSIVFLILLLFRIDYHFADTGLIIFGLGTVAYFLSWISLIVAPEWRWSRSVTGFTAPAWTPVIWFWGLTLMGDSFYFEFEYSPVYLIVASSMFLIFHVLHSIIVYRRDGWGKIAEAGPGRANS